jgi:hypothetical protein
VALRVLPVQDPVRGGRAVVTKQRRITLRIPKANVVLLRQRVAAGETAYAVAKELGIDVKYAYRIVKGQVHRGTT